MITDILSRTHLLVMRAQTAGTFVFDGHQPSDEEIAIQQDAAALADRIMRLLDECRAGDIPVLADCFDNAFRIGYRQMPDSSYMDRLYRRAFEAWRSGRSNIEESSVFAMIAPRIGNPCFRVDHDQTQAYLSILRRWLDTLGRFGHFPEETTCENYLRLSLLPLHRIKTYCQDPAEARRRWYEINRLEDLTGLGHVILRAYRRYISSLWPDVITIEEQHRIDNQILNQLTDCRDLDPRDRRAYRLALTQPSPHS